MGWLYELDEKMFPKFQAYRYYQRRLQVLKIRQKAIKSPKELSIFQIKKILSVLHHHNILEKNIEATTLEKDLLQSIPFNTCQALLISFVPFLIRQTHNLSRFTKFLLWATTLGLSEIAYMYPNFKKYIENCRERASKGMEIMDENYGLERYEIMFQKEEEQKSNIIKDIKQ